MQYSPPMRIYLIMTLAFFALSAAAGIRPLAITFSPDAATIRSQSAEDIEARRLALRPSEESTPLDGAAPAVACGVLPGPDEIAADGSLIFARDTEVSLTLFARGSPPEIRNLDAAGEACIRAVQSSRSVGFVSQVMVEAIRHPAAYEARAAAIASQVLLLGTVAFALLNLALHPRRRAIEHLVFSLYWNAAFVPPVLLVILAFNLGGGSTPSLIAIGILALAALVFAMLQERGFYGSSWIGTALRLPLFLLGYGLLMAVTTVALVWLGAR